MFSAICNICKQLDGSDSCTDRFVVYKYTRKTCGAFYVGKTARMFIKRHKEHQRAIQNKSLTSALSDHIMVTHRREDVPQDIGTYTVSFVSNQKNTRDTAFMEALTISQQNLNKINRRHELPSYMLASHFITNQSI